MTKEIKATAPTPQDWIELVRENERLKEIIMSNKTKTVADAVEYYKENGKISGYSFSQNKMLSFCKSNGTYCFVSERSSAGSVETEDWQPICTREQFEACVKEQESSQTSCSESEKWTHTWNGRKCKVVFTEDHISWVKGEGLYKLVPTDSLKPIKPTISESEAIDILMANKHLSFAALLEDYDVVKD